MSTLTSKVAIIDDDFSICRALARLLRAMGFETETFHSGESFLGEGAKRDFSCLLVDVQLGGISGLEMHRRLLAMGNRTPVVFITAHDDPALQVQAEQNGCAGFLRKCDPGTRIADALRNAGTCARDFEQAPSLRPAVNAA